MRRICYECDHCKLDVGWVGTDVTPGDSPKIICELGHWEFDPDSFYVHMYERASVQPLAECLERAATCPDFVAALWAGEEWIAAKVAQEITK